MIRLSFSFPTDPTRLNSFNISTFVLSNTSDLNEMELLAWRSFYDDGFGLFEQAENFCTGKIMYWMRDFGYTARSIVVTENDELITDTTYDYDLCAEFISILNYE